MHRSGKFHDPRKLGWVGRVCAVCIAGRLDQSITRLIRKDTVMRGSLLCEAPRVAAPFPSGSHNGVAYF